MTILRDASTIQIDKLESNVSISERSAQSRSCPGECYDCDNCGGSQTH